MSVFLFKIQIFPIKSFDPLEVDSVKITPGGSLDWDRRFVFFRKDNQKVISRKWEKKLYAIRTFYDLKREEVTFSHRGMEKGFKFSQKGDIERFIGDILG